jgi:hypothetical protein
MSSEPFAPAQPLSLDDLYRSWGILDLLRETVAAVPPQWLLILDIARNLLDGRPIPGITLPPQLAALLTRAEQVSYERRTVRRKRTTVFEVLPDHPEVRPIESLSELPRVVINQRMWQFIDPRLFLYRVYSHDVLVREPEEQLEAFEREQEVVEEVLVPRRPERQRRQKVLVLRDTSNSMRDGNKGIFAKAVALAYLVKAQEEGAEVSDRSFANRVHARLRARTPEQFAAIARRILSEGYYGTTNLAEALDVTMREIRREELGLNPFAKAQTEILLISDCENPVQLPLLPPGVTINTLHLQGGREGRMLRDYAERLKEIQDISRLFVRIDTSALSLPDRTREAWLAREEVRAAEEAIAQAQAAGAHIDPALHERLERARHLTAVYEGLTRAQREHARAHRRSGHRFSVERLHLLAWLRALLATLRALLGHTPTEQPAAAPPVATPQSRLAPAPRIVFRPKG